MGISRKNKDLIASSPLAKTLWVDNLDVESIYPPAIKRYLGYDETSISQSSVRLDEVRRQGVYFLVHEESGEIEYVGQTTNLYGRMGNHEKLKKHHIVAFLPIKEKRYLNTIEEHYIRTFRPPLNVKMNDSVLKEIKFTYHCQNLVKEKGL